jgi:hypothetical protein
MRMQGRRLAGLLQETDAARFIATSYLASVGETDWYRAALRLDMPAVLGPFDTIVEPEAARRWLGERIRGDFGIGAIIDVDDWRLSRTEVGACVLAMGGV